MGMAKLCGFLATSVLLFILLVDSIAGIRMPIPSRKESICSFPVVIRGAYQNAFRKGKPSNFKIFEVSVSSSCTMWRVSFTIVHCIPIHADGWEEEVFKSPRKLRNNVKIYNKKSCYYPPEDVKEEFVIYGLMHKRGILCRYIELMDEPFTDTAKALAEIAIDGC
ncbi:UNVERIFIED_CONTAM: hypothetical protein K2H54_047596 [Gekko kuhli]